MRWQGEPVDPDDVSRRVRELMEQPEFRYDKSILDRIGEWIGRQLDRLFGEVDPTTTGTFGGGAGSFVAWLIIALALVAVVATILYVVLRRVRRAVPEGDPDLVSEIEHATPAAHWAREAERHEAEGRWKDAMRCRYRELVRTLVDRRQLPDVAGRTTGELRGDLARTTPDAASDFDRASLRFELAWYADASTAAEDVAAFRAEAASVLVADRVELAEEVLV